MVYPLRRCLVSVATAFAVLQLQQATATSLQNDPVTKCSSFDLSNKNFPGRGAEVEDDGTCTVIFPKKPTRPNIATNPTVVVTHKEFLANAPTAPAQPIYTKVGTMLIPEQVLPEDGNPDAYVKNQVTITPIRKLETCPSILPSKDKSVKTPKNR